MIMVTCSSLLASWRTGSYITLHEMDFILALCASIPSSAFEGSAHFQGSNIQFQVIFAVCLIYLLQLSALPPAVP